MFSTFLTSEKLPQDFGMMQKLLQMSKGIIDGLFPEVKAQPELRFARDLKESYCHSFKIRRVKKENVGLFPNGADDVVTMGTHKAVVPRAVFASGLPTGSPSSLWSRFKEENYQQWVRIKSGIAWESSMVTLQGHTMETGRGPQ